MSTFRSVALVPSPTHTHSGAANLEVLHVNQGKYAFFSAKAPCRSLLPPGWRWRSRLGTFANFCRNFFLFSVERTQMAFYQRNKQWVFAVLASKCWRETLSSANVKNNRSKHYWNLNGFHGSHQGYLCWPGCSRCLLSCIWRRCLANAFCNKRSCLCTSFISFISSPIFPSRLASCRTSISLCFFRLSTSCWVLFCSTFRGGG